MRASRLIVTVFASAILLAVTAPTVVAAPVDAPTFKKKLTAATSKIMNSPTKAVHANTVVDNQNSIDAITNPDGSGIAVLQSDGAIVDVRCISTSVCYLKLHNTGTWKKKTGTNVAKDVLGLSPLVFFANNDYKSWKYDITGNTYTINPKSKDDKVGFTVTPTVITVDFFDGTPKWTWTATAPVKVTAPPANTIR